MINAINYEMGEHRKNVKPNNIMLINVTPKGGVRNVSEFHNSIRFLLLIAQFFWLLPIYGIRHSTIDYLQFKWFSWKTLLSFTGGSAILIVAILYFAQLIREDMDFGLMVSLIFYISQAIGYLLFIRVATKWYSLNTEWLLMEKNMKKYEYKPNDSRRFKIATFIILGFSLSEHIFSILKGIKISQQCPGVETDPLKAFFSVCCAEVFTITEYSHYKAVLIEIPIILSTFHWNFMDLFIILMSAALAERFRQINKRVLGTQIKGDYFWKETREDFTKLWMLCRTVDDSFCHLISLSFASNLFFICWQMFNSLKPQVGGLIEMIYFFNSFGYLLGRTATVSVYCCWINDESKEMLTTLFNLPSESYGQEANRLIQQICFAAPALTGSNFFSVTRSLCLQVAGAIITFEIILIQVGPSFLQTDKEHTLLCKL